MMFLCEKQKDLRAPNEILFRLADLENRKYRNRYYVTREKLSLSHNLTLAVKSLPRIVIKLCQGMFLKSGKKQNLSLSNSIISLSQSGNNLQFLPTSPIPFKG